MAKRGALTIDASLATPVYQQIVLGLRRLLVAGELAPGTRLPAGREMAIDLGVHHNTVAEAYRQLAAEGWLTLRRGRGAEVRTRREPAAGPETRPRFARQLAELTAVALAAGLSRAAVARELTACAARLGERKAT